MFKSTSIIARRLFRGAMVNCFFFFIFVYGSIKIVVNIILQNIWNNGSGKELAGQVRVVHQYVNMTEQTVDYYDSSTNSTINVKGCEPAIGESFTTGTADGPGVEFYQKNKEFNWLDALWSPLESLKKYPSQLIKKIIDCVTIPNTENEKCHRQKKIIISQVC